MADIVKVSQLVQYSDSSGEEEEDVKVRDVKQQSVKRRHEHGDVGGMSDTTHNKRSCLELPSAVLTMFNDTGNDVRDDRAKHQGRTRTFAHERGNWATYVYFPVEVDRLMVNLVHDLLDVLDSLAPSDSGWTRMPDLHLSMSRTVIVFHHWITDMMAGLGTALRAHAPFDCYMGTVELYTNDDKTRTFFGLRVTTGHDDLERVVGTVDRCLAEYQLEGYYKNPSFHVSIAWTLGDLTATVTERMKDALQELLTSHIISNPRLGILDTSRAEAKCGNRIFTFPLLGS